MSTTSHWGRLAETVLDIQYKHLQKGLDVLHDHVQSAGLQVSTQKSRYVHFANKSGRKSVSDSDFHLKTGSSLIPDTQELRILGLEVHQSRSSVKWIEKISKTSVETVHLIRRIFPRSGGARTDMVRCLVHYVLQPRVIYQVQFLRLVDCSIVGQT